MGEHSDPGAGQEAGRSGGTRKRAPRTPLAEWIAAGISATLALLMIGYLLYEAVSATGTAPRVEVEVVGVSSAPGGYVVEIRAHNRGDATAKGLSIDAELRSDTGIVETTSTTLDYLPGRGRREAGVFFTRDPRRYHIELTPKGYDLP